MRFSLGPAMLQNHQDESARDVIPRHTDPDEGTALLPESTPRIRLAATIKRISLKMYNEIRTVWNPPLTGAILAIFIGTIPPIKHEFYHEEGFFYGTITTSLSNIGELFTALMLFVLGANLQIKTTRDSTTPILTLLYIYVLRFILMPFIGIIIVWKISAWGWLNDDAHEGLGGDPMMKFIMCLIPAGPPYISCQVPTDIKCNCVGEYCRAGWRWGRAGWEIVDFELRCESNNCIYSRRGIAYDNQFILRIGKDI
jgi:predicted permease